MSGERFRDGRERIYEFADEVLVVCPGCGGCAVVSVVRRRLTCPSCGATREADGSALMYRAPVDPVFRRDVWLRADFRGHLLWAYNARHLEYLAAYVGARLRERGGDGFRPHTSMVERLPGWMNAAKNRDALVRAFARMRATLPAWASGDGVTREEG
ncbi:hypothetical protein [Actinocorallia sp. A-T 12471]|uniref:hypothetical protein n=1 Tax=Actinocorallia sp. A-T 12471 TaxID=3089813 RepID=UPI0029D256C7|nr:hypothetical protein [Actinocorallia sp. A-T 12471]MDX6745057.1 hypothetical protein [Actinocorallia sp. A-T 12471]